MITFVDRSKVRDKGHPGYCYLKAGFRYVRNADGTKAATKSGLVVLQMTLEDMPEAEAPHGAPIRLAEAV